VSESGDTDPETPKKMQQNEPNPTGEGGDRDEEAGERDFVEDMESDPARAGVDSPANDLLGG
jgi:hypothetical protein